MAPREAKPGSGTRKTAKPPLPGPRSSIFKEFRKRPARGPLLPKNLFKRPQPAFKAASGKIPEAFPADRKAEALHPRGVTGISALAGDSSSAARHFFGGRSAKARP
jgi:hypothetical protein